MKRDTLPRLLPLALVGTLALAACGDDDDNGTQPTNRAPTASFTIDPTSIPENDGNATVVTLDASGSTDPDGDALTHQWAVTGATFVNGTSATSEVAEITLPGTAAADVTLTVSDGSLTDSETQTIGLGAATMVVLDDRITSDMTLQSGVTYILDGPVPVGEDCGPDPAAPSAICVPVTLTIEPGTTILGKSEPTGGVRASFMVINRGSKIVADANANAADRTAKPAAADVIVFTSDRPRGQRQRGDWGGLVINGRAPLNTGPEAQGEGDSGLYGGVDDTDNSGILRGVRVEFAGDDATSSDQFNGIAFQGVGAGTTVDYVQVHYNVDDGTEPFGGSVSQTHMVVTGIGDDSYDGTDGYRGFIQFAIAQQRADDADNGLELSNNGDNGDEAPQTTAVISNATIIGAGVSGEIAGLGGGSDVGALFREGANWRLYNSIITNFGDSGFCVENAVTFQNATNRFNGTTDLATTMSAENNVIWSNGAAGGGSENFANTCNDPGVGLDLGNGVDQGNEDFFTAAQFDNVVGDPNLPAAALAVAAPDFQPSANATGWTAFDVASLNNEGGAGLIMPTDEDSGVAPRVLVNVDYAGAVDPGAADPWYEGWTVFDPTGQDSRPNQDGL